MRSLSEGIKLPKIYVAKTKESKSLSAIGLLVGAIDGENDGVSVGAVIGAIEGDNVGAIDGAKVGASVQSVGDIVCCGGNSGHVPMHSISNKSSK